MLAIVVVAAAGLHLNIAGITVAERIKAACRQLGIDGASLTVPAALRACNEAMGIEQSGPLIAQADTLAEQLGLRFDASSTSSAPEGLEQDLIEGSTAGSLVLRGTSTTPTRDSNPPATATVHAAMSSPTTVVGFSKEDVSDEALARALDCQFWAPNHKLKGSWRFVQLGPQSRVEAARLCAGQAPAKAEARLESLRHIPGCLAVLCRAYYECEGRLDKEQHRALTAAHNVALGLTAQGLAVKWITGATTENYELWELLGLDPNREVVVGLLWYGRPAAGGTRPVKDQASTSDKWSRLP